MNHNTERGYKSDWKKFDAWARARGVTSLPVTAADIIEFIEQCEAERLATRTIARYLYSIFHKHKESCHQNPREIPEIRTLLNRIENGPKRERLKSKPIRALEVQAILLATRDDLIGLRDRVLILLLWELRAKRNVCSLTFEGLSFPDEDSAQILFDDNTAPAEIQRHNDPGMCLVSALKKWKSETGIHSGCILRRFDRHGNIYESLSGTSAKNILNALTEKAGMRGPYHLSSFRRPMMFNSKAIVRTGIKGLRPKRKK